MFCFVFRPDRKFLLPSAVPATQPRTQLTAFHDKRQGHRPAGLYPRTSKSLPQETSPVFFFIKNLKVLASGAAQEDKGGKTTDTKALGSFQVREILRKAESPRGGASSEGQWRSFFLRGQSLALPFCPECKEELGAKAQLFAQSLGSPAVFSQ